MYLYSLRKDFHVMGKPIRNLLGQKFNKLTPISMAKKPEGSVQTGIWWKCLCDCGNETTVKGTLITNGSTKSCGCYKREVLSVLMSDMRVRMSGTVEERFLSRFKINKSSGCWDWIAHTDKDGYGLLPATGKAIRAHRYSIQYYKKCDPKGFMVCHTCDNPRCVNPDHLFLGTAQDNISDMLHKNRDAIIGSKNNKAKLTEEDALFIFSSKLSTGDLM